MKDEAQLSNFDVAQFLDNEEMIAEYISQILEDGDTDELIEAIGHIAKARGMAQIAKDTGLGRESLYKSFKSGARPRFETVMKVLKSLGIGIKAKAIA